jgi:hypothetical protein
MTSRLGGQNTSAGCGFGAIANAIAVGLDVFRRAPIMADMILMALENGKPVHESLTANI